MPKDSQARGIIRLVVPDLEGMARDYLRIIDDLENQTERKTDHQWMILELFDQMTREKPQGMMGAFLSDKVKRRSGLIRKRIGGAIRSFDSSAECQTDQETPPPSLLTLLKKLLKDSDFRTDRFIKFFFPKCHKTYLLHPSGSIFVEICLLLTPVSPIRRSSRPSSETRVKSTFKPSIALASSGCWKTLVLKRSRAWKPIAARSKTGRTIFLIASLMAPFARQIPSTWKPSDQSHLENRNTF